MNSLLKALLKDYGFLAAMVGNLDAARQVWARQASVPDIGMNQYDAALEFEEEYSQGETRFRDRTPTFLYGMCLVYGYGLFEDYLHQTIRELVRIEPRSLLRKNRDDRKVDYRIVLENFRDPDKLLDELITRELLKLAYGPMEGLLSALRQRFGLSSLPDVHDERIIQLGLIRNCIVHNRGMADARLSAASRGFYGDQQRIYVDRNMVSRSISVFCGFAQNVEQTAAAKFQQD